MAHSATEDDIRRIYRDTIDDLYRFVSRRCDGDRALAEDVTQETWLRAVRVWYQDGLPERPLGWLTTVAARLLSNHFRRPAEHRLDEAGEPLAEDRDAAVERREKRSLVERALARLPLSQMRLLEAFHFERAAVGDIAASSGLSERAVEGRLRRARQNLRKQIEADLAADGEEEGDEHD
ncbi:MAG TPA: sigma-70 family RNA polymerase sigma factor [Gemmatimonadaceae bacterium]|nr:sigma-70 family RNA polymerase sigma factor [Gemmatimonadaceae bacterium]